MEVTAFVEDSGRHQGSLAGPSIAGITVHDTWAARKDTANGDTAQIDFLPA